MRVVLLLTVLAGAATLPLPGMAASTHVHIQGFAFDAGTVQVAPGDSVTWDNHDGASHTVTSDDNKFPSSPTLGKGATHTAAFPAAGTYLYHCAFHPSMRGKVEVVTARPENRAPSVRIDFPASGGTVRGVVEFAGEATDPDGDPLTLKIFIDGQASQPVDPIQGWKFRWDSRSVADGNHTVTARASDGSGATAVASVSFRVANTDPAAASGSVQIGPLRLKPGPTIREGETVLVSARFTSTAEGAQTFPVRFLVLGSERERRDLTLAPRTSQEVEFRFRGEQTGLHEVTIEAPSLPLKSVGTIDVLGGNVTKAPETATGGDEKIVIPGPAALLTVLAAVAFAVARRR